jgi:hypothetical protein
LRALADDLGSVLIHSPAIRARQRNADRDRLHRREGQSDDYRKHAEDLGEEALPFEGAADTRPPEVDKIINERVALLVESLMSGEIQAAPLGLDNAEAAARTTRLLRHLRGVSLRGELRREAKLLANYMEGDDPGVGVLKVWWRREAALELRVLSVEDVARVFLELRGVELPEGGEGDGGVPPEFQGALDDVVDVIHNRARDGEAMGLLEAAFPKVRRGLLRKALRDLRRVGEADLPVPFVRVNRPAVSALRYMEDVFFSPDIDDVQRARSVHEVERLSEADLRSRALSEDWGGDFVEAVLEAGPGAGEVTGRPWDFPPVVYGDREADNLYEVWFSYTKASDGYGIPGVYLTVWSERVPDYYGRHELLDYPDGEYPFVLFTREAVRRGVAHSRGVARIAGAAQHEIKVQRDCRTDYTQVSTVPPVRVRSRIGGLERVLGPMSEVVVRDPDDVSWLPPPPFPQMSVEVERATRNDVNEYFGRLVEGVAPELRQALLQDMVNAWADRWVVAWQKLTQLLQEFMDPVEIALVAGGAMRRLTREEIRGQFEMTLTFSVQDLSPEFVMKRLDAIGRVLAWDVGGIADRNTIMRLALRGIDPALADVALRDAGSASVAEQREEIQALVAMAQGIEPPLAKSGVNAELRLRTLVEAVNKSPVLARRLMQPASQDDEYFRELVENRQKNLSFLVEQYQVNPEIGRTGTTPVSE